jgi:deoxyribodipyrimidine photolyase-related protein
MMKLFMVLGDQLNLDSPVFELIDKRTDKVWMAEVEHEANKVWSHKARICVFISAMRHFRLLLSNNDYRVEYHELDDRHTSFSERLSHSIKQHNPEEVILVKPGEYDVMQEITSTVESHNRKVTYLEDPHFLCDSAMFDQWYDSVKQPRQESFYRFMRKNRDVLMQDGQPLGEQWNFDKENRKKFNKQGPGNLPKWPAFSPDKITRQVINIVNRRFKTHPGSLDQFDWPVTRDDALALLEDFIDYRLPTFGPYQDAMWSDEPFLYHSGLSLALNLKLLNPAEVLEKVIKSFHTQKLPLASVEGFVRQVLGWREYIHGLYWKLMPEYRANNYLNANYDLPDFFWTAKTDMNCIKQVVKQTLKYGYAHHIQRLMITGLFALLYGVKPKQIHEWYLAVYVDAVEWVELPNVIGMSQYADGGVLASKPYVASGKYIKRMSNYCQACCYNPEHATGKQACPFTTLYWDFLQQHQTRFAHHPRTALQWRNLGRRAKRELTEIRQQARAIRDRYASAMEIDNAD